MQALPRIKSDQEQDKSAHFFFSSFGPFFAKSNNSDQCHPTHTHACRPTKRCAACQRSLTALSATATIIPNEHQDVGDTSGATFCGAVVGHGLRDADIQQNSNSSLEPSAQRPAEDGPSTVLAGLANRLLKQTAPACFRSSFARRSVFLASSRLSFSAETLPTTIHRRSSSCFCLRDHRDHHWALRRKPHRPALVGRRFSGNRQRCNA